VVLGWPTLNPQQNQGAVERVLQRDQARCRYLPLVEEFAAVSRALSCGDTNFARMLACLARM
jgi:hypothetical protein